MEDENDQCLRTYVDEALLYNHLRSQDVSGELLKLCGREDFVWQPAILLGNKLGSWIRDIVACVAFLGPLEVKVSTGNLIEVEVLLYADAEHEKHRVDVFVERQRLINAHWTFPGFSQLALVFVRSVIAIEFTLDQLANAVLQCQLLCFFALVNLLFLLLFWGYPFLFLVKELNPLANSKDDERAADKQTGHDPNGNRALVDLGLLPLYYVIDDLDHRKDYSCCR